MGPVVNVTHKTSLGQQTLPLGTVKAFFQYTCLFKPFANEFILLKNNFLNSLGDETTELTTPRFSHYTKGLNGAVGTFSQLSRFSTLGVPRSWCLPSTEGVR